MSAALKVLRVSLAEARRLEKQYRDNEDRWLDDAMLARRHREACAAKAAELEQAITRLGGSIEEVPA